MTLDRTPANPLSDVTLVRVGTLNPPKLAATRAAFEAFAPGVAVQGVDVASGVPDQPVGFDEIVAGARERARAAFRSGACDLAVGIEDGLVSIPAVGEDVMNVGAAAVTDGHRIAVGLSSGFMYPPGCSRPAVSDRVAIGDLFDDLMGDADLARPSARGQGNIGRLTLGVLNRDEYGRHAVVCALVHFLHPSLYDAARDPGLEDHSGDHADDDTDRQTDDHTAQARPANEVRRAEGA